MGPPGLQFTFLALPVSFNTKAPHDVERDEEEPGGCSCLIGPIRRPFCAPWYDGHGRRVWVTMWWGVHTARGEGEGLHGMEYGDMMEWILGTFGGPNYHHLTLGCTSSQYHVKFSGYASWQEEWEAFLCCFCCVTYDTLQTVLFTRRRRRRRRRSGLYYFHLTW